MTETGLQKNAGQGEEQPKNASTNSVHVHADCSPGVLAKNENPGERANASGAKSHSFFDWIDNNTRRDSNARTLTRAVADCDPADRLPFLETLIEALRQGAPIPSFAGVMTEAREWAMSASRVELKAFALASYEAMNGPDQAAFLGHLDRRAAA